MKDKTGHSIPDQPESWRWPEEKWRGIVNKIRAGKSLRPMVGQIMRKLPLHCLLTLIIRRKPCDGDTTPPESLAKESMGRE